MRNPASKLVPSKPWASLKTGATRVLRYLRLILEWIAGSAWRYFPFIFLLSLGLNLTWLNKVSDEYLILSANSELGSIAIALRYEGEFANPYIIPTGPTAHLPPIPPLITSLVYRIFGLTPEAGYVNALLIIITISALYALLPWFSDQLGIGCAPGAIGALFAVLTSQVDTIWALPGHGEYLTGLLLGLVLVFFLRRWSGQGYGWGGSLLFGLAIGLAFHVQPGLLPVVVGLLIFELYWLKNPRKWLLAGMLALGILIACLPWGWRNYSTFNTVFFIRSNLGLELRMGNNDQAAATFNEMDALGRHYLHPRANIREAYKLLELGEIEYMRQAKAEALAWIRAHPTAFLGLAARRFANLWAGIIREPLKDSLDVLALTALAITGMGSSLAMLTTPQRAAILIPLITYPLIYYVVAYEPRYRIPIDWILFALAGAVVWKLLGGSLGTRQSA